MYTKTRVKELRDLIIAHKEVCRLARQTIGGIDPEDMPMMERFINKVEVRVRHELGSLSIIEGVAATRTGMGRRLYDDTEAHPAPAAYRAPPRR